MGVPQSEIDRIVNEKRLVGPGQSNGRIEDLNRIADKYAEKNGFGQGGAPEQVPGGAVPPIGSPSRQSLIVGQGQKPPTPPTGGGGAVASGGMEEPGDEGREPNPYLEGEVPEPGTRRTGVRRAIQQEVELVRRTGKGTIDWTPEEIEFIQKEGRLPPGIVGHQTSFPSGKETREISSLCADRKKT